MGKKESTSNTAARISSILREIEKQDRVLLRMDEQVPTFRYIIWKNWKDARVDYVLEICVGKY